MGRREKIQFQFVLTVERPNIELQGLATGGWEGDDLPKPDVALPAPSRKSLEFYVRALDGQNKLELDFLSAGRRVASRTLAVQPLSDEDRLILRLSGSDGWVAETNDVVVRIEASELPRRWNGLDPVQVVVTTTDEFDRLDAKRQKSLRYWQSTGGHVTSGTALLGAVPSVDRDDGRILASIGDILAPRSAPGTLVFLVLAVAALIVSLALPGFARVVRSPARVFAGLALTALVASVGIGLWGKGWPVSALETAEFSVFRSQSGGSATRVTTDGVLRSGIKDLLHIRTDDDIHFKTVSGLDFSRHVFFEDGSFEFQISLGLGQSIGYRLTGFVDKKPLDVEVAGSVLEISSSRDWMLSECLFVEQGRAFTAPEPVPGQPVTLDLQFAAPHPTFFETPSTGQRMLSRLLSEDESTPYVACVAEGQPSLAVPGVTVRGAHTALLIRYFKRESSDPGTSSDGQVSGLMIPRPGENPSGERE